MFSRASASLYYQIERASVANLVVWLDNSLPTALSIAEPPENRIFRRPAGPKHNNKTGICCLLHSLSLSLSLTQCSLFSLVLNKNQKQERNNTECKSTCPHLLHKSIERLHRLRLLLIGSHHCHFLLRILVRPVCMALRMSFKGEAQRNTQKQMTSHCGTISK